jgi:hypothetical protein
MWARFRARTFPARYPASYARRPVEGDRPHLGFLSPFGRRHSLLGHPVPPVELVHRYLRLTATLHGVADPDGVSAFRTHEKRLGLGAPCTPGTVVSTRPHTILGRHPPPSNGRPLSPRYRTPPQGVYLTRHQRGFTGIHPKPSLPLTCGPRTERGPLGFPVSFAPDRRWAPQPRTSRWGQVSDTDPDSDLRNLNEGRS